MLIFNKKNQPAQDSTLSDHIKAGLDSASSRIMIANNDRVIIYANPAAVSFLKKSEADIRKSLPTFSADNLIGVNIDTFYKNPGHQQSMLENLRDTYDASISIGEHIFNLSAIPLFDSVGKRIGTLVEWFDSKDMDNAGQVAAINRSQATITFTLDGTILEANDNFLKTMGYSLSEIKGKHHSMFADPAYAGSAEYKDFWKQLNNGEYFAGEFKRFGKGGKEIWLHASYNPIFDAKGKPVKVIKYASDITSDKLKSADYAGQIAAINKAQAVIEFNLDGTVITANDNFLKAIGYSLPEIHGKHHQMFVDPAYAASHEYTQFWEKLRRGEFDARVYKRIAKGGREIWIQASYNPILDMNGKPFKVVKFATEITEIIKTADLADQTSANVQSVAAAVEEMSASIMEISKNMALSKDAAQEIISKTTESSAAAEQLISSMKSMENVVALINNIAGQVNLLALNATIEAARAGEAGKGFAVVAAEVKTLATQTTKATDDIANEIKAVQSVSSSVADSVKNIATSAGRVNQYVTGVATAIEEQSAVTKEISGNTQRMASSVDEIARRIKDMSKT